VRDVALNARRELVEMTPRPEQGLLPAGYRQHF